MTPSGSRIDKATVDLAYELLNLPEHGINDITVPELKSLSAVELLLGLLLDVGVAVFCQFACNRLLTHLSCSTTIA